MAWLGEAMEIGSEIISLIEQGAAAVGEYNEAVDMATDVANTARYNLRKRPAVVTPDKPPNKRGRGTAPPDHNSNNPGPGRGIPLDEGMVLTNTGPADHEVDVIPIPRQVALACPDYFTIDLPMCETGFYRGTRGASQMTPTALMSFRMNSIWDPISADARTTGVIANHQPMGRDTWSNIFQYYRVLKCHLEVVVWNKSYLVRTTDLDLESAVVGIEWTDDDTATGKAQTIQAFMEEKQCQWKVAHSQMGVQSDMGQPVVLTYDYTPEEWDYHVQNASSDTRWTLIGNNPSLTHVIALSYFPFIPGAVTGKEYAFDILFKVKYTVQFREAVHGIIQTAH